VYSDLITLSIFGFYYQMAFITEGFFLFKSLKHLLYKPPCTPIIFTQNFPGILCIFDCIKEPRALLGIFFFFFFLLKKKYHVSLWNYLRIVRFIISRMVAYLQHSGVWVTRRLLWFFLRGTWRIFIISSHLGQWAFFPHVSVFVVVVCLFNSDYFLLCRKVFKDPFIYYVTSLYHERSPFSLLPQRWFPPTPYLSLSFSLTCFLTRKRMFSAPEGSPVAIEISPFWSGVMMHHRSNGLQLGC